MVSILKKQYSQIETMVIQNNISYHENDDKKNVSSSNEKKNKIFGLPKKNFFTTILSLPCHQHINNLNSSSAYKIVSFWRKRSEKNK